MKACSQSNARNVREFALLFGLLSTFPSYFSVRSACFVNLLLCSLYPFASIKRSPADSCHKAIILQNTTTIALGFGVP